MESIEETEVKNQAEESESGNVSRQTVSTNEKVSGSLLAKRIIYYIGGAVMTLLAVRFVLLMLGASRASAFVDLIYSLSGIFVAPFSGIFEQPTYGASTFDSATIVAIIVYAVAAIGIAKLLTINKANRDEV